MSRLLETIPEAAVSDGACALPSDSAELSAGHTGSPRDAITFWRHQGAHSLFFFDADAAAGTGSNLAAISEASHHGGGHLHTTYMGGVRDHDSLTAALGSGVTRIVLEVCDSERSWAKDMLHRHGQRLIAGVNVHGTNAVDRNGSTVAELFDLLEELEQAPAARYLLSEVSGHDHWFHRDRHMVAAVCETVQHPVEARGAVQHDSDIHALVPMVEQGLEAVVVGKALATGAFTYQEAVTAAEARYDPYIWAPPQP
jgi:phosphoribosylformimino-5-aminoimidazole carboxamide ribotide isomerase/phosphoribosylanthranilate isomerase